ncbi:MULTISPECIES: hypothetical protein [unclassified Mesorhizobium]|uniref:hypothetical protein n=1 Tax=unclassified Mesorhizobium TaxID=325217 RepID=UPI00112CF173|nr:MULTISPECIES: hypothetical protein [unclassified Mesorhizobium]TPK95302.1 hypothetical protein FJ567_23120 [Mesorhizobium sp. B2-4-16]TPL60997.1 hypothetical protein FJ956_26370 [Mesorhizobium sp. B2-4-3]
MITRFLVSRVPACSVAGLAAGEEVSGRDGKIKDRDVRSSRLGCFDWPFRTDPHIADQVRTVRTVIFIDEINVCRTSWQNPYEPR